MPNDAAAEKASSAEHGDGAAARCHDDSNSPIHVGISLTMVVEGPIRALEQPDDLLAMMTSSLAARAAVRQKPVPIVLRW